MKYFHFAVMLTTAIVLTLFSPITASAKTTTLHTSVPNQVSVIVKLSGNGTVTVNGQALTNSGSVQVDRLEDVTVSVSANVGNLLNSIQLNGTDATEQVGNGTLVIENIQFDTTLTVVFVADTPWIPENNPRTGDATPISIYWLCAVTSIIVLLYLARSIYKKRDET